MALVYSIWKETIIELKRKNRKACKIIRHNLSEKNLHQEIQKLTGINIPQKAICPGHNAPFEFVADSYFEKTNNCIVIAPRSGGKTINSAALEFMEAKTKPVIEIAHLGAIYPQAQRAYKYIQKWGRKVLGELERSIQSETIFRNGALIEVLVGTISGVNSPHPHKATIDEFELLPWEVFEEAGSMPKSGHGYKAAMRLLTTRKKANGNAQKMVAEHKQRGFKLYTWCIFEVMTPCGCKSCSACKYKNHMTYDNKGNKITWPEVCQGRSRKACGYLLFQDVLRVFLSLSWEVFKAQWLCERPEKFDAVFPEFSYARNTLDTWKIQRGEGWQFGRGWDFGLDDPTAVGFYNFNKNLGIAVQINELVISGALVDSIAERIKKISVQYKADKWIDWGDPSGKQRSGLDGYSYISKLAKHNIHVRSQHAKIEPGIRTLKKLLGVSSFTGKPSFFLSRERCPKTIEAFEMTRWDRTKGDNEHSREKYRHDQYSHPLDQCRYFLQGEFPLVKGFSFGL